MSIKFKCLAVVLVVSISFLAAVKDVQAQQQVAVKTDEVVKGDEVEVLQSHLDELNDFQSEAKKFLFQTQATVAQFKKDAAEQASQKNGLNSDLARLRDLMKQAASTGSVTVNGKEISHEHLEALARSTIEKARLIKDREESAPLSRLSRKCHELQRNLSIVFAKQVEIQQKIKQLKTAAEIESRYQPLFEKFSSYEDRFSEMMGRLDPLSKQSLSIDSLLSDNAITDELSEINEIIDGSLIPDSIVQPPSRQPLRFGDNPFSRPNKETHKN